MSTITTAIPVEVTGLSKSEHEVLADIMQDIKASLDGIRRAARRWMELSPKARVKIVEQTRPNLRDFWAKLEAVGTGALHPQLATVSGLAARYLGKLSIEEQKAKLADAAARRLLQEEAKSGLKSVDRVGWKVEKGRVFVKANRVESGLTRRDLETMLRDLEG